MSIVPANIVLEIDSLTFADLSPHDARRAAASFENTMTVLISDQGLPRAWQTGSASDLDLSGFENSNEHPIGLGESLAQFIYQRADR
jgi:hypothetical protein